MCGLLTLPSIEKGCEDYLAQRGPFSRAGMLEDLIHELSDGISNLRTVHDYLSADCSFLNFVDGNLVAQLRADRSFATPRDALEASKFVKENCGSTTNARDRVRDGLGRLRVGFDTIRTRFSYAHASLGRSENLVKEADRIVSDCRRSTVRTLRTPWVKTGQLLIAISLDPDAFNSMPMVQELTFLPEPSTGKGTILSDFSS